MVPPKKHIIELGKQLEYFKELQSYYFRWQGTVIALSAAILGYVSTRFLENDNWTVQTLAFISLGFFIAAIIYAIWCQKIKIETEISRTVGRINEILEEPLTELQKKAIQRIKKKAGKTDRFGDHLLLLFLAGIVLLVATICVTTFIGSSRTSELLNVNSQPSQQSDQSKNNRGVVDKESDKESQLRQQRPLNFRGEL